MNDGPAIIRLLRPLPGSVSDVTATLAGVEFNSLAVDAARHGLSGVLNRLVVEGLAVPASVAGRIRSDSFAIAASSLRAKSLLLRALEAMDRRGVQPILLKGYGLAFRLYPDPLMRPTSDVDLLASPEEDAAAEHLLLHISLRPAR